MVRVSENLLTSSEVRLHVFLDENRGKGQARSDFICFLIKIEERSSEVGLYLTERTILKATISSIISLKIFRVPSFGYIEVVHSFQLVHSKSDNF